MTGPEAEPGPGTAREGDQTPEDPEERVLTVGLEVDEELHADAGRHGAHMGWGVQARMFIGIGAFMAVIGTVYWFMSYEWAGTVLLGLTASMAVLTGVFVGWPRERGDVDPDDHGPEPEPGHDPHDGVWFPEASVWPFAIGAAMVLVGNGLLLGRWLLAPAAVFLVWAVAGMVRQGRHRV